MKILEDNKKAGIVIGIIIIIAVAAGYLLFFKDQGKSSSGLPVYQNATKVTIPPEAQNELNLPAGTTYEVYKTSDSPSDISSWYEQKMTEKGWEENQSIPPTDTSWFSLWKKNDQGARIIAASGVEAENALNIEGTALIIYSGDWEKISQE